MELSVFLACAFLTASGAAPAVDEPVNPDVKGLFDFSELDVPKEEERSARETAAKEELLAESSLPDEVRRMLDRLTVFEVVENDVMGKRVAALRTELQVKLLALADKMNGQAKADAIALAKYVEGFPVQHPINPASVSLMSDPADGERFTRDGNLWNTFLPDGRTLRTWADGRWRWVNKQHTILLLDYLNSNYVDVVFFKSPGALEGWAVSNDTKKEGWQVKRKAPTASTARKPPPDGLRFFTIAAKFEASLRTKSVAEIMRRRTGVANWLTEQAKNAAPAVALKILARSNGLRAAPGASQIERAERMAGVWLMTDGRKLELLPDGTVTLNSQPAKATWIWAKERNWNTALIRFGNPDDPSDVWMARISSKEPGSLWVNSRDKSSVASLR